MIATFNILILILIISTALIALGVRDILTAVISLGAFSFLMCLLWAELGAPDVAFTEASVGAGISTVLYVATILHTSRRSED